MRTSVKYLLLFISLMAVSCSKQAGIIDNQEIVFSATNLTISVADLKNTQNSQGLNGAYLFENQTSFQDKEDNGGFFNIKAIILAICLFVTQKIFPKLHPIALIGIAAVVGIIFRF